MNGQPSLSEYEYSRKKRKTRKEIFLERMEKLIPWSALINLIKPHYPSAGAKGGRPAKGIEKMLRMLLIASWFNLSDEGTEDAVTENQTIRRFVRVDLSTENAPDATTLLQFRHLLERNGIFEEIFEKINELLLSNGMTITSGSIVDASIIEAPKSTKNANKERDPEMRSTQKGNQWYFGMKAHIGVDEDSGIIHSVTATAANVHDITEAHNLLRETDLIARGDAGFVGLEKREEIQEKFPDLICIINQRPGKMRDLAKDDPIRLYESSKASIRAKVERPFLFVKRIFGYGKVRYRGIAKNLNRLFLLFACTNLILAAENGDFCYSA